MDESSWLVAIERALHLVEADVRATGLEDSVGLILSGGSFSYTGGITPRDGGDQVSALLAVADDVQDAIMGSLMTVWPVCPDHDLGGHPREHDGQAVWWCNGGGGHVIAPIGRWSG